MGAIRKHALAGYFVIAFTVSWAIWIPMAFIGAHVYQGSAWPTHIAGLLGPAVAAFVMSIVAGRRSVVDLVRRMLAWRVALRWYLVALSPLAFFLVAALAVAIGGGGWPAWEQLGRFSGLPMVVPPLMFLLLLLLAFGEETGWRGYALPEMLQRRSLLASATVIGLLWALWHVPSFFVVENYRQLGLGFLPMFTIGVVSGSILLAWLYRESGGSIWIVALWHATYNLVSGTAAATGLVAAIVSSAVMVWAGVIIAIELARWYRGRLRPAGAAG